MSHSYVTIIGDAIIVETVLDGSMGHVQHMYGGTPWKLAPWKSVAGHETHSLQRQDTLPGESALYKST